jgi:outer membrane receptor protein involved in Fe transport
MQGKSISRMALLGSTAAALTAFCPQVAMAQDSAAADPDNPATRGEIIVTANKREERLLDVAGSISVVGGEDLDQRQALDLQDLARSVAGLNLQQGATPGVNRIILRGLNAGGDGATVASMVDDAPLSFSGANTNGAFIASDFQTYDLQRIEVLRGPQGTLYGATSEGGLVRYVTNPADPSAFAAGAQIGGSSVDQGGADGFARAHLNLPLGENAAIRFTGFYDGIPGWGENPQLGEDEINGGRRYGGRANLFLEPTDNLTITALALYQDGKFFGNGAVEVNGLTDPADPFGLVNGYAYNSNTRNLATNTYQLYSLNMSLDVGFGTLQSITSYGEVDVVSLNDVQAFANALVPSSSVQSNNTVGLGKFTQELRLASDVGGEKSGTWLDWQLGFFYTKEKVDFLQEFTVLAQPSLTPVATFVSSALPSQFEDVAGYANATLHFGERFDIEFGLRVARNNQNSQLTQSGLAVGGATITNPVFRSAETATTFQIAPRLRINDDAMIYARVARGYRPGGPQIPVPGAPAGLPESFGSDSTINYEIGFKGSLLDDMLTVDLAAFYIDWSNVQVLTGIIVGGNQFTITGNVGEAVSKGFEWGFELKPTAGLTLSAIGAYTDATFTRPEPTIGALDGSNLPYVADLTSTIGFDYEAPLSDTWDGFIAGSWTYTGKRFSDFPFNVELPSFSTFDAQLGVRTGRYSVELFGKNLSDERGITNYVPLGATGGVGTLGIIRPRTIGIRLTADF